MRVRNRVLYRRDLERIMAYYIANDLLETGLRVLDEIRGQIGRLRDFPESGRLGRVVGTRELVVARTPFIVVYGVRDDVFLLRLLHGVQQWPPASTS